MAHDWTALTDLTGNREFTVNRVTVKESGIALEGDFELPALAKLTYEDQVFVAEFIRRHGNIRQMEQSFGVSYPTIKARLNRIAGNLQLVDIRPVSKNEAVLAQLESGEITPDEAVKRIKN